MSWISSLLGLSPVEIAPQREAQEVVIKKDAVDEKNPLAIPRLVRESRAISEPAEDGSPKRPRSEEKESDFQLSVQVLGHMLQALRAELEKMEERNEDLQRENEELIVENQEFQKRIDFLESKEGKIRAQREHQNRMLLQEQNKRAAQNAKHSKRVERLERDLAKQRQQDKETTRITKRLTRCVKQAKKRAIRVETGKEEIILETERAAEIVANRRELRERYLIAEGPDDEQVDECEGQEGDEDETNQE